MSVKLLGKGVCTLSLTYIILFGMLKWIVPSYNLAKQDQP
jgi:hypothetical protein